MGVIAESLRVSIRAADRESDLTLAADVPVRELLPALLDVLGAGQGPPSEPAAGHPSLRHPVTGTLDGTRSLADCGVRDGDLLILTTVGSEAPRRRFDSGAVVTETVESLRGATRPATPRAAAVVAMAWWAGLAAALLGRPLPDPSAPRHVAVSAVAAAVVMGAAVLFGRCGVGPVAVTGLGCAAAILAGICGALTVPGGPGVANFSLAMSVCAATASASARLLPHGTTVLVALCAAAGSAAAASVGAVLGVWPTTSLGPLVAVCGLAALTAAPRLAARAARLPALEPDDPALPAAARTAHHKLDTLVSSASATAALGCVVTSGASPPTSVSAGFVLAVAAALALSARIHDRPARSTALLLGAAVAVTALSAAMTLAHPARAAVVCGLLGAVCAGLTWWGLATRARPPAAVHRLLSAAELLVAVAVVPLGCWTGGVFAGAGGWGQP